MFARQVCAVCGDEVLRVKVRHGEEVLLDLLPDEDGGYVLTGLYVASGEGGKVPEAEQVGLMLFSDLVVRYSKHKD